MGRGGWSYGVRGGYLALMDTSDDLYWTFTRKCIYTQSITFIAVAVNVVAGRIPANLQKW